MGCEQQYLCPSCGHRLFAADEPQGGEQVWLDYRICTDCEELVRIVVKRKHEPLRAEDSLCSECQGGNLTAWTQCCPKCSARMNAGPLRKEWD